MVGFKALALPKQQYDDAMDILRIADARRDRDRGRGMEGKLSESDRDNMQPDDVATSVRQAEGEEDKPVRHAASRGSVETDATRGLTDTQSRLMKSHATLVRQRHIYQIREGTPAVQAARQLIYRHYPALVDLFRFFSRHLTPRGELEEDEIAAAYGMGIEAVAGARERNLMMAGMRGGAGSDSGSDAESVGDAVHLEGGMDPRWDEARKSNGALNSGSTDQIDRSNASREPKHRGRRLPHQILADACNEDPLLPRARVVLGNAVPPRPGKDPLGVVATACLTHRLVSTMVGRGIGGTSGGATQRTQAARGVFVPPRDDGEAAAAALA